MPKLSISIKRLARAPTCSARVALLLIVTKKKNVNADAFVFILTFLAFVFILTFLPPFRGLCGWGSRPLPGMQRHRHLISAPRS